MAKLQSANEQARHNFVAHTQTERGVEHVVGQAYGCRQGNYIAREQRQLHTVSALRNAVAHGGYAAGNLSSRTHITCCLSNNLRRIFVRLVRGQHVVVSGDDAHVRGNLLTHHQFVVDGHGREGVSRVGTAHAFALGAYCGAGSHHGVIVAARCHAPSNDSLGYCLYHLVHGREREAWRRLLGGGEHSGHGVCWCVLEWLIRLYTCKAEWLLGVST